ncbi:MaoC family dehydratase [Variovorax sp. RT4R15]|uniref:MaoC family dehydratase n=1 Tax=Variovorax sp. RT4R15 TaxID=3443737 RepID=UPI003F461D57
MLDCYTTDRLDVGVGYRFSRHHTFDEEQARSFSLAAGDENPLHLDADYARSSRFGGLIVSGTHSTSILMGLSATHFSSRGSVLGKSFSFDLLDAVRANESVELEWIITSVASRLDGQLLLGLEGTIRAQDGRTLVLATSQLCFAPSNC